MAVGSPTKKAVVHPPRHPIEASELGRRFNPYDILGIPKTATTTVVKRAYRKRALKLHPDKNPGEQQAVYAAMFNNLTLIYESLLDPPTRQAIDDRMAASEQEEATRQMQTAEQSRLREDLLAKERVWKERSAARDERDRIKAANQELLDALKARREKELLSARRPQRPTSAATLGKRPRSPPAPTAASLDGIINSVWDELVRAAVLHDRGGDHHVKAS
ncbi:hypothetical protein FOZ61_004944 [Perkinsus olseni]|uniref:J domain-containing protein n=1 Tax=Perkinsus olseni TaxID=32597 RepID=A0A7J6MBZ1_PEROL|nr:hypothetical protein FOL46_004139 [Perkinsus olseni]KAF4669108.1 hypothetical protein FOZ61_004944 [Perkinsus olseni]